MVYRLLFTSVLLSLPLLLTRVHAEETSDSGASDRFIFPSSSLQPVYYTGDTLLVKYNLEQSGPVASSLALSLKCMAWPDVYDPAWNDAGATTVGAVKRNIPLTVGTVPFILPPVNGYQAGYGAAACFFLLKGRNPRSAGPVNVQSSLIQIGYDTDHKEKTYISEGSKGEVPNGDYKIIDGNGTYDITSRLSTGAKAGIGAGVGVGVIALLALGFFLWWRRRRQKAKAPPPAGAASTSEPGENKIHLNDEAGTGELHGNHVNELEGKHAHEIGPGVERVELGGDHAHHRFELP